ncbi:acyl-CoA dehydrogenase family protein [Streptomyces sp. SRF1]|uniref:acyl-CoA dehydrogenase family protein n=1 Tax=Streptomyces sp. SRF1 TaxID=1549642 RepID=UPI0025B11F7E|nr:acyl-CoA dehydrogenase family protein [Streptomyces sp. SRF1]MDN3059784.1 acyl-CoA dehydrogenase family protein [Streptomyces sp. SRF1]
MTVFLVPASSDGVEIRRLATLGHQLLGTFEVFLDDVEVTEAQVLGEVNDGWAVLRTNPELEQMFNCGGYVGAAQTVLDMTVAYVNSREQFRRPIGSLQAVAHPIADMYCDVAASRLLTYQARRSDGRQRVGFHGGDGGEALRLRVVAAGHQHRHTTAGRRRIHEEARHAEALA